MDMTEREAEPHFSQPVRQVLLMLVAVGLFSAAAYVAFPRVAPVFLSNPYLNGVILLVFVFGVVACFWQVLQLISSVRWIVGFSHERPGHQVTRVPRLLAPLAALLRSRGSNMQIGASSARSILESVATRIEEARDITRYIVNLLIFLGLLGTFYGLATTVPAVVETIGALAPAEGEDAGGVAVFTRLMAGLKEQLGGMGTAFASSLLGLAGSLVVGLLELFASHGQNRFYRELEEWLSTITQLGFASSDASEGEGGAVGSALLHLAEQMGAMQRLQAQQNETRAQVDARLDRLTDALSQMSRQSGGGDASVQHLAQIAEGQERLLAALKGRDDGDAAHVDAESRMRLRSIDVQLLRILEEISAGRQESLSDLRGDLAALTRAIRQRGGE